MKGRLYPAYSECQAAINRPAGQGHFACLIFCFVPSRPRRISRPKCSLIAAKCGPPRKPSTVSRRNPAPSSAALLPGKNCQSSPAPGEHVVVLPNQMFRDIMRTGPFRHWAHTHKFIPENEHFSWLEDTVEYGFPLGKLGEFLAVPTPTAAFSACSNGATELPPNNSLPGLPTLTCISEVRGNSIDPAFVLLRSTHRMPHDNIQTFSHGVQHFSIF